MVRNVSDLKEANDDFDPDEPTVPSRIRGLLAWQRIRKDAIGWNAARKRALNQEVHSPVRVSNLADVPAALEAWEQKRKQFERLEGTKLAPTTVLDALRHAIPLGLEDKVQTRSGTLNDESSLREYILNQCFEARPGKEAGQKGTPLKVTEREADGLHEEEPAEEELNSWQQGGGWFDGTCSFCGNYGHKKAACRELDKIMEAQRGGGKGGGGKGDGKSGGYQGGGKGGDKGGGKGKNGGWWKGKGVARRSEGMAGRMQQGMARWSE